jgi:hypothetical protein
MFEKMRARAEETGADIAMCDYARAYSPERVRHPGKSRMDPAFLMHETFDKDTIPAEPRQSSFFSAVVCWNKIFRRDFYLRAVRFPENMIFEDAAPMFSAFAQARSITAVDERLYFYRISNAQSSTKSSDRRSFDIFRSADMLAADMEKRDYGKFARFAVASVASDAMRRFKLVDKALGLEYYDCLKILLEKLDWASAAGYARGRDRLKAWCVLHSGYRTARLALTI